jgi:hypothetical protein
VPDSNKSGIDIYLPSDLNRKDHKERKEYSRHSILCDPCVLCGQFSSLAAQRFPHIPLPVRQRGLS